VANSLAAVQAGARQIECTINGLGERAGNCALEEVVMALRTRPQLYQITTGIKTEEIIRASRMVSEITGILVQPNKAIVGSNAFAHEAGIHQHGVLAERSTYEIMDPASVGLVSNKLVLGKHSGRHAFDARLKELGLEIGDEEMARAFERFKELCDKKKQVFDEDIEALVADEVHTFPEEYKLDVMTVTSALPGMPTAAIRLKHGDGTVQAAEIGVGSVDAVFRTLDAMVQVPHELEDYTVKSITGGTDAMAEVTVKLRDNGRLFTGRGAALDIIVASAKAYLQAINKLVDYGQHRGAAVNPKEAADLTV
ncbi:MAG TPA: alpha-isopropylmalate synthase regulatory domain-containing protein, partial [Armatimonadota bacterium]